LVSQRLMGCPVCQGLSAVHYRQCRGGSAELVRFVCPLACPVDPNTVLSLLALEFGADLSTAMTA
jgi:hypothetical protein